MEKPYQKTTYEIWQEEQGIPVVNDYFVPDLTALSLHPWSRLGGKGLFINLIGAELTVDCYVCEISPGDAIREEKHLYEEVIFILSGRGATTVWNERGSKQVFEWQEGSLFSPPLNTWHQLFNGQGDKPARFLGVSTAPMMINIIHNLDFIFNNNYTFHDRYDGSVDYFGAKGKSLPWRVWESNFIPDVRNFKLKEWKERGASGSNIMLEFCENILTAHISEFPFGTYKKAHRHGPGAHIIILNGKGYSLIWPEGGERKKIDWHEHSMFSPPDQWFHQHFNIGNTPARYLAIRRRSEKYPLVPGGHRGGDVDRKLGGRQIEYEDEDPSIRELFAQELSREGVKLMMPPVKR